MLGRQCKGSCSGRAGTPDAYSCRYEKCARLGFFSGAIHLIACRVVQFVALAVVLYIAWKWCGTAFDGLLVGSPLPLPAALLEVTGGGHMYVVDRLFTVTSVMLFVTVPRQFSMWRSAYADGCHGRPPDQHVDVMDLFDDFRSFRHLQAFLRLLLCTVRLSSCETSPVMSCGLCTLCTCRPLVCCCTWTCWTSSMVAFLSALAGLPSPVVVALCTVRLSSLCSDTSVCLRRCVRSLIRT